MDQNVDTFLSQPDIMVNSAIKFFMFSDDEDEALKLQHALGLTDYYREVIMSAGRGEGVLALGRRDIHHIQIVPSGREFQLLARHPTGDEWVIWG